MGNFLPERFGSNFQPSVIRGLGGYARRVAQAALVVGCRAVHHFRNLLGGRRRLDAAQHFLDYIVVKRVRNDVGRAGKYGGNKRFNDIAASIPKITNRVLSKELKHLEENLLISRTVIDDYPVRIEYALTAYCLRLEEVALPLEKWGKNHKQEISKSLG